MKDVKQKHQQKLIEQKIQEERKKEEEKYVSSMMEEKKYDWRKELNEQMTTSDVFFTTLPATGDVNLSYPNWNISGGTGYSSSGSSATITNTGSIGPGGVTNGFISSFDTSYYDTLVFDVVITGNSVLSDSTGIIATSSGTYSVSVTQSPNKTLLFASPALSIGTVTISNLRFQRRTPLNVFVGLDSPEASSFMRTGNGDLSAEERKQKIKEMLEASDEYVTKMLGLDFPGTGAVAPGEYDPFKQAPPGEAGDTPGVEIAGGFGLRPDGTSGMNKLGDKVYDPHTKKEYELVPSPKYGGGSEWKPVRQADTSNQDTQIAQIQPAQQRRGATGVGVPDTTGTSPGSNPPPSSQMNYPKEWLPKQAKRSAMPMVASYEPQGQVLSEKKLKKVRAAAKKPK